MSRHPYELDPEEFLKRAVERFDKGELDDQSQYEEFKNDAR